MAGLLFADDKGLACPLGELWVDPWKPVPTAVITHAHADHARPGMGRYICAAPCEPLLRRRIGRDASITPLDYRQPLELGAVTLSLHPAGHCLGAAQVRVEHAGEVAVAAGDYKRDDDPTCARFELVPCDTFVTEATFALPIYRWDPPEATAREILAWWDECRARGRVAVLLAYALGKAQRVLAELRLALIERGDDPDAADPDGRTGAEESPLVVRTHGAVEPMIEAYREQGVAMLPTRRVKEAEKARGAVNPFAGRLVLAPPSAAGSPWMRRFGPSKRVETGFVSGWMRVRGIRRRRGYDRGFVMSDHADWPALVRTCEETGAARVLCTHGYADTLAKHLTERGEHFGRTAEVLKTEYESEDGD